MKTNERAFTRIDLVTVVAMVLVLGLLGTRALATAADDGASIGCLDNQRTLLRALHLYTSDNADFFPLMDDISGDTPNSKWLVHNGATLPDSTNSAKLVNPNYSMLAIYLQGRASVFKCPADLSTVSGRPTVRSISMSQAVGTDRMSFNAKRATAGPWLDGAHAHVENQRWRTYARLADVVNPRPADLFIFLDEAPTSMNDAGYAQMGPQTSQGAYRWIDWPAAYHQGGAGFGFADGHGVIKRWLTSAMSTPTPPPPLPASLPDLTWISVRTSAFISDQP